MAERVIWQRTIDHDKIAERRLRFIKQFGTLAAVVFLTVLIVSGFANAMGVLIVLGIIGMAWGSAVRYKSLSDSANPTMVVDGGILRLGNLEVFIEDIKRFTTTVSVIQTSVLGKHSRIHVGKAIFRLDTPGSRSEPKLVEFGWPNMDDDALEGVTDALVQVLPNRWVELADLVEADKLGRRRRPRLL